MWLKYSIIFFIVANIIIWGWVILNNNSTTESNSMNINKSDKSIQNLDEKSNIDIVVPKDTNWFSSYWPIISSVLTTIPTIVIQWKKMLKSLHRKRKIKNN